MMLSGLLWHGSPHVLLQQIRDGQASLIESPALLEELEEALNCPKYARVLARIRPQLETLLATKSAFHGS
jgi:predicted nucleic acid-binding protein